MQRQTQPANGSGGLNRVYNRILSSSIPHLLMIGAQLFLVIGAIFWVILEFIDLIVDIALPRWFRILYVVLAGIGAIMFSVGRTLDLQGQRKIREQITADRDSQIKIIENEALQAATLEDLVRNQIQLAIAREKKSMDEARMRAESMYSFGFFFQVLTIACPIVAGFAYLYFEPTSAILIERIAQAKKALGELPKDVQLMPYRDWRILVAGVTSGCLCLAVARSFLSHQAKEMIHYTDASARVSFFERLASSIDIKVKAGLATDDDRKAFVGFVVDALEKGPEHFLKKDDEKDVALEESPVAKTLIEIAKSLVDATKTKAT